MRDADGYCARLALTGRDLWPSQGGTMARAHAYSLRLFVQTFLKYLQTFIRFLHTFTSQWGISKCHP